MANKEKWRKVESIEDLKQAANRRKRHCAIQLTGPGISSKDIYWGGRKFYVTHYIDGTVEKLTKAELDESNIGLSIRAGGFFIQEP